jgi:DtxR family Mn-dependent transcriptional regulator
VKQSDLTPAVQDYAKAIYALEAREGQVSTSALARRLGVSAPSVSGMIRTLVERGLVAHEPYRGITLTPAGVRVALEVMRHHRLLELFLAEALGVPWDRVHDEAEVLEHALSEELEERIAASLGDPSHDPHGDPIPTREGTIEDAPTASLAELTPGASGLLARISDADPAHLRSLAARGIQLGDRVDVVERRPGKSVSVLVGPQVHALREDEARSMRVLVEEKR